MLFLANFIDFIEKHEIYENPTKSHQIHFHLQFTTGNRTKTHKITKSGSEAGIFKKRTKTAEIAGKWRKMEKSRHQRGFPRLKAANAVFPPD